MAHNPRLWRSLADDGITAALLAEEGGRAPEEWLLMRVTALQTSPSDRWRVAGSDVKCGFLRSWGKDF